MTTTQMELVPFHDHHILSICIDGKIYIVMKPIVERLGLKWSAQHERIKNHPVLAEGIRITRIPSAGGDQEMLCLELEAFHGWLLSITPTRILDLEVRGLVIQYQRRSFRVVFEHFHGPLRVIDQKPASVAELLRVTNALERVRRRSVRNLLWQRLDQITDSWQIQRCERVIGYEEPDYSLMLAKFWAEIEALAECGILLNRSRRIHLIALNMPEVRSAFFDVGVPIEIDSRLLQALRHCEAPAYIADKTVNCEDGKARHCWVFSHAPLVEART